MELGDSPPVETMPQSVGETLHFSCFSLIWLKFLHYFFDAQSMVSCVHGDLQGGG